MTTHPQEWVFVAALVAVMVAFHWAKRLFWAFTLLVLPGTFAHELSHWLLGILLNGRPSRFNLFPRRDGPGWIMGSVSFANLRWYNAFFIGMAPLLLLPLAYWALIWRLGLRPTLRWEEGVAVYLIANLVYAGLPSWMDVKAAARSPFGWMLLAGGLVWGYRTSQGTGAPARVPTQVRTK